MIRLADAALGRMVAVGRAFCTHAAAACPASPLARRLRCGEVTRVAAVDLRSGWTHFVSDRFDGGGALRLSDRFALQLIDCLLGGEPQSGDAPDRPLTSIERALVDRCAAPLLRACEQAWDDVVAFTPASPASEGPWIRWLLLSDAHPAIELLVDEACAFALSRETAPPPLDVDALRHVLSDGRTALDVTVASPRTTVGALHGLRPGALLPLDVPIDAPWTLRCGPVPLAAARPANLHGCPHLIVTEKIEP